MQSIELLLDPAADAAIRHDWAALAAAGLPSLTDHTGPTNRPHVTLLAAAGGLTAAIPALRTVLGATDLAAVVGAPLLFGGHRGRWVLARHVVVTRALLDLHASVHAAVGRAVDADAQTRPDAWTPHVTLARRLHVDRLPDALAVLGLDPLPCRLVGARLWDSPSATVTALA